MSKTTNNNATAMEETTMRRTTEELLNDALTITSKRDKNYVSNEALRNVIIGIANSKKTRNELVEMFTIVTTPESEETTIMGKTTWELLNDTLTIVNKRDKNYVTKEMLRDATNKIIRAKKTRADLDEVAYLIVNVPSTEEAQVEEAQVEEKASDDKKLEALKLTHELMNRITEYASANKKLGFGTTVSAKMLCAFIIEVATMNDEDPIKKLYVSTGKKDQNGRFITKINPKVTQEHKDRCVKVRKWLIEKGYLKVATFKDEKGFGFYTPEYDGNRKDKLFDVNKYQATGKTETTTYRVTEKINEWYSK